MIYELNVAKTKTILINSRNVEKMKKKKLEEQVEIAGNIPYRGNRSKPMLKSESDGDI